MKRQKLAKEALDWINSLELPSAPVALSEQSGYLCEQRTTRNVGDEASRKAAYRRRLLHCGLSKWIRKHKSNGLKKLRILEHEVNASLRLQDWRSRVCLNKWLQFVQLQRIAHYVGQRAELKLAMGMPHRYKLQLCLHYWLQKTNIRLRMKIETFQQWKRSMLARNLARMVLKVRTVVLLKEGFARWKRRSKWPLVATKRAHWLQSHHFLALRHFAHAHHKRRLQQKHAELYRIKRHFLVLVARLIAQKQAQSVLQMGSDLHTLRRLTHAIQTWHRTTALSIKVAYCLHHSLTSRRKEWMHECIRALRKHAQRAVRAQVHFRLSYLHHKRCMFRRFMRGVAVMRDSNVSVANLLNTSSAVKRTGRGDSIVGTPLRTPAGAASQLNSTLRLTGSNMSASNDTQLQSSARGTSKAVFSTPNTTQTTHLSIIVNPSPTIPTSAFNNTIRGTLYTLFSGQLFPRSRSLVSQWRTSTTSSVIQREALHWGDRWFKRRIFRALQLSCRKRRNLTLVNCYASLQCKHRLQRKFMLHLHHRALLRRSLHGMSMYIYMRKYMRRWVRWCNVVQRGSVRHSRAKLRWALNKQQNALRLWYHNTQYDRRCRFGLNVFRKLHPVPATSAVGRVFNAWRYEYVPYNKTQRRLFKAVVALRKVHTKRRVLHVWGDVCDTSIDTTYKLRRGFAALQTLYTARRNKIYALCNALILHKVAPQFIHTGVLVKFFVYHGLMVRNKHQLRYFYTLCFVRKYMQLWRQYSHNRRKTLLHHYHTYTLAAKQCSAHFAHYYHTLNKHKKWVLWRAVRGWYNVHYKRQLHFSAINTRIHLKQPFFRWVELYNRKMINYHLCIPSATTLPVSDNSAIHNTTQNNYTHNSTLNQTNFTTNTTNTTNTISNTAIPHDTLIQHNSQYVREAEQQRLRLLRSHAHNARQLDSTQHSINNISAISAGSIGSVASSVDSQPRVRGKSNTLHSTSAVSGRVHGNMFTANTYIAHKPKYTKLIDTTHTTLNNTNKSTMSTTSNTSYAKLHSRENNENKPVRGVNRSLFSDNLNTSYSRLREDRVDPAQHPGSGFVFAPVADTSSMRVSGKKAYGETVLRKSVNSSYDVKKPVATKPVWGKLIEEDHVDAAKRSYMGQYLLSKSVNSSNV